MRGHRQRPRGAVTMAHAERDDTRVRLVQSQPGARRRRVVPVADLLAREGRPLDVDDDFLLTDALVSVRRGMAGLAAGLLVVVGGASAVGQLFSDTDDRASSDDGRSAARERSTRPAETSRIEFGVADVASRTRATPSRDGAAPRTRSMPPRTTSHTPPRTRESSGGGDADYRKWSGDYGRTWSGNYGRDWSGNYGSDYWGG